MTVIDGMALVTLLAATTDVTVLPDFGTRIARLVVCSFILGFYIFDFLACLDRYRSPYERRVGMAFRGLIRSSQILLGCIIIWMGALSVAFFPDVPIWRDFLRYSGYLLLGGLAVGGITLVWSHLRGDAIVS